MPKYDFFQKLGFYAIPAFVDADSLRRIGDAMAASPSTEGTVGSSGPGYAVDRNYRRTRVVAVADALRQEVKDKLLELKPQLERHYGVELAGCQPPQFLAYGPGDYYKPHRDGNDSPTGATISKVRRVSAVVFLNPQTPEPRADAYGGGALTFYEMFDDAAGRGIGLPLDPEPGLLVTFRADVLHAVAPVTHGERRTLVSWFTG